MVSFYHGGRFFFRIIQEFVLRPVQFNVSINNLEREVNSKTNPLCRGY